MNNVILIGRLTKDPDIRYSAAGQIPVGRFSIAIDRGKDKNGNSTGADYPSIVCFGKTAELVEKYLGKGRMVGIQGKLQTSSYEKNGQRIYTTEVVADRIEFLDKPRDSVAILNKPITETNAPEFEPAVDWHNGFTEDGDLPF